MPNHTTNYNLIKPTPAEFYDIEVHNENMDTIDTQMKSTEDELTTHMDNDERHLKAGERSNWNALSIAETLTTDILNWARSKSSNSQGFIVDGGYKPTDSPIPNAEGFVTVITDASTSRRMVTFQQFGGINSIYTRRMFDGSWSSSWRKVVQSNLAWIEATPQNGWQQPPSTNQRLRYTKDDMGFVHVQGEMKDGVFTKDTIITTLPVGYRPASTLPIQVIRADDASFCPIQISASGQVLIMQTLSELSTLRFNSSFYVGV